MRHATAQSRPDTILSISLATLPITVVDTFFSSAHIGGLDTEAGQNECSGRGSRKALMIMPTVHDRILSRLLMNISRAWLAGEAAQEKCVRSRFSSEKVAL